MTLLESIAGPADELPAPFAIPADLTLSRDSRFLYARTVRDGDGVDQAEGARWAAGVVVVVPDL